MIYSTEPSLLRIAVFDQAIIFFFPFFKTKYLSEFMGSMDGCMFCKDLLTASLLLRHSQVGIHLRPHDLRRHAATYASRSGTPIEIVSKVILRHANLSTTQRHLGRVSDLEAMRWIENLYG